MAQVHQSHHLPVGDHAAVTQVHQSHHLPVGDHAAVTQVHQSHHLPVGDHAAVTLALQTHGRFADLLGGVEWDAQVDHAVGVVDGLAVDYRLLVGHQHLLLIGGLARPHTQLSAPHTHHCLYHHIRQPLSALEISLRICHTTTSV